MAKQQIIRLFNTTPSEIDNEFVSEDYDNKEPDTKGESLGTGPVLIYQKNSSFNGSSFVIGFVGGAQLDGKYEGMSHLLEHLLFRPAQEGMRQNIMNSIMAHSIGQNAFTSEDCIAVSATATTDNFERALQTCVAMLKPAGFTREQIKKEIEVIRHEIMLDVPERDDVIDIFLDKLAGYDPDPTSKRDKVLGSIRTLNSITPELLSEYVRRYFTTDNLVISVTSNAPVKEIVEMCQKYVVSQFPRAEKLEYVVEPPEFPYYEEKNLLMAIPNAMTSNVDIQLLVRTRDGESQDPDREFAYDVIEQYINNVIGGNMWNALRVKRSLVYTYAQSAMDFGSVKFKNFAAETNAKNMRATIKELCGVVATLASEGVPAETFETVKKAITDRTNASLNKYRSATALSNFDDFIKGTPFIDYKKATRIIESTTCDEFNAYLMEQYKARNVSLLVTGGFNSHNVPNLIEVEEMVGNMAHSEHKEALNVPRFEFTAYVSPALIDATRAAQTIAEQEAAAEEAMIDYLKQIPPILAIDDSVVPIVPRREDDAPAAKEETVGLVK